MRLVSTRLVWMFAIGAALGCGSLSSAQEYRPDEFLTLDLSSAVLSPKALGPVSTFRPGPLDVTVDRGSNTTRASAEFVVEPKAVTAATVHAESGPGDTAGTPVIGRRAAHSRLARSAPHASHAAAALHRHSPMEAQARDTSVQVWPCRSGGICNWKR